MIDQQTSQPGGFSKDRLSLSTRGRFILLIVLLNFLLLAIVFFSIRNQEIITKRITAEAVVVKHQTHLAIVIREATRIVYVTQTFTPLPNTATAIPTPTFTETPLPPTNTPTSTPIPTNTPTSTSIPTNTPTPPPTSTDTATPTPSATISPTPTPTTTITPSPTPTPTFSPTPTSTSTATPTHTPTPTDTPTFTPTPIVPIVTGISPDNGGNESIASTTISGENFQSGATVQLNRSTSSISAINIVVVSATQITCQFDLGGAGAAPGAWDVTVTNPDSQSGTLANGFQVNPELEHFNFGNITNQVIDVSFPVTITAQDLYNNTVTSFNGTATLSDSTGTVNPTVTGNFVNGVWTGNVTISQVQASVSITATSGGRSGTSNSFAVRYPTPSITAIQPNTGVNTAPVAVTITGTNFVATPGARLGVVSLQNVTFIDPNTLTADVPAGMAAGTYDLYVTNPGPLNPTGMLTNAFTVQNLSIPSTTLETSFITTYGISSTAGTNGDNDSVQIIFFEVPDTLTNPLYVRIYDPDVGGGGHPNDIDHRYIGPPPSWDTSTTFSLYGGNQAFTHSDARQITYTTTTDPGIQSGTLLFSQTFTSSATWDKRWFPVPVPITPTLGEHVGSKYILKLAVTGGSGDDGNLYNIALSTSSTENIAPPGGRIFAYSWTFRLPYTDSLRLYPYVASTTDTFTQHNFDFDRSTYTPTIDITTPITTYLLADIDISEDGDGSPGPPQAASSYSVTNSEQQTTWAIQYLALTGGNDGTAWFTDQNGNPLPIFTRSTTEPAPTP